MHAPVKRQFLRQPKALRFSFSGSTEMLMWSDGSQVLSLGRHYVYWLYKPNISQFWISHWNFKAHNKFRGRSQNILLFERWKSSSSITLTLHINVCPLQRSPSVLCFLIGWFNFHSNRKIPFSSLSPPRKCDLSIKYGWDVNYHSTRSPVCLPLCLWTLMFDHKLLVALCVTFWARNKCHKEIAIRN